jgi:hypothetical protein
MRLEPACGVHDAASFFCDSLCVSATVNRGKVAHKGVSSSRDFMVKLRLFASPAPRLPYQNPA